MELVSVSEHQFLTCLFSFQTSELHDMFDFLKRFCFSDILIGKLGMNWRAHSDLRGKLSWVRDMWQAYCMLIHSWLCVWIQCYLKALGISFLPKRKIVRMAVFICTEHPWTFTEKNEQADITFGWLVGFRTADVLFNDVTLVGKVICMLWGRFLKEKGWRTGEVGVNFEGKDSHLSTSPS
jgi:hypothetical protein